MKESEKADKNVNAREIIANVLKELDMNAPSFSTATGISYQRIFDLQRGRTKKFNPGVVNMICEAFPAINKSYLYTGEGPVMVNGKPQELDCSPIRNVRKQGFSPEFTDTQKTWESWSANTTTNTPLTERSVMRQNCVAW